MSRLQDAFIRSAFVAYLVGGDGGVETSASHCLALIEGGVDVLELGIPFSDPTAEGPVITEAVTRTLKSGITFDKICAVVELIRRKSEIPIVLMGYYNSFLKGSDLYRKAARAGVDGLLVVDLPPEEAQFHCATAQALGLDTIFLATPDITESRLERVVARSRGFLYYVCRRGTTGVRAELPQNLGSHIERIRRFTSIPIAVGFGIGTREAAAEALKFSNAFVVGSVLVDCVNQGGGPDDLKKLVQMIDPRGAP